MIFGFRKTQPSKNIQEKYLIIFLNLIPDYCATEDGKIKGRPEEWQSRVISYSLYLGLGIGVLNKQLGKKLLEGITPGMRETSDLVLTGLDEIKKTPHAKTGDMWSNAVNFISNFMSLTSQETIGPDADEELVKQRAPISGFIPGLRLFIEDMDFALALYNDAVQESEVCEEELSARIVWMKELVDEVMEAI